VCAAPVHKKLVCALKTPFIARAAHTKDKKNPHPSLRVFFIVFLWTGAVNVNILSYKEDVVW